MKRILVFLRSLWSTPHRALISTGAMTLFGVALTGVIGRLTDSPSAIFHHPRIGEAKTFTTVVLALLLIAWIIRVVEAFLRPGARLSREDAPIFSASLILVVTIFLFRSLLHEDSRNILEAGGRQIRWVNTQILSVLDSHTRSCERMAARWNYRGGIGEAEWLDDAARQAKDFPGVAVYAWIDRTGTFRYVYPAERRPRVLNYSIRNEPEKWKLFQDVKETGKPRFTGLIEMRSGGQGFAVLVPVYKRGEFDGVLTMAYMLTEFMDHSFESRDYRIQFIENDRIIYENSAANKAPPNPSLDHWAQTAPFRYRTLEWSLRAIPRSSAIFRWSSPIPILILLFGLFVALMTAFLVRLYLTAMKEKRRAWEAAELQAAIFDGSALGIVATDMKGIVTFMNPAAEKICGYASEDVVGKETPQVWTDPEEVLQRAELLRQESGKDFGTGFQSMVGRVDSQGVDKNEWKIVRKDGEVRDCVVSVHALHSNVGTLSGYVGILEDVTEKKELDRKLVEQQAKMIQSSKLASLGEMAAGVAHEINNPLLVISGKVQKIHRLYELGKESREEILAQTSAIRATVDRIAKIISGLRSFSRDSSADPFVIESVQQIVTDTLAFCYERFRNGGVELKMNLPDDALLLECRPYQISQILLNLLNNAFDAVSDGKESGRWVDLTVVRVGSAVAFSVTDGGPGIRKELRDKIMLPFFTTKEVGRGTGLGLSVSQGIAKEHRGSLILDAHSSETRFILSLPLRQGSA